MSTSNLEALASRSSTFSRPISGGLAFLGVIAAAWTTFADYRRVRRAENDLAQLDDRLLRDIGISRTEIAHLARFGREAVRNWSTS